MATIEKKKKKAKVNAKVKNDGPVDEESKTGSLISVREAQENDKADTVQQVTKSYGIYNCSFNLHS